MSRVKLAISKLLFCLHISSNSNTFFKLLWNTKRSARRSSDKRVTVLINELPATYQIRLRKKSRDIFLRTLSGDLFIFYEVFWNRVYELPAACYRDAKTIVDLGANVGLATLYFRQKCSEATIYAVEPEDSNFKLLLQNSRDGIMKHDIVPLQAAIDSEDGNASIQVSGLRYNSTIIPAKENTPLVRTISIKTLMRECRIERIDILKIDVEGAEQKLFEGAADWLDHVKYLLIEFHSAAIKSFCTEVLLSKKFTIYPVTTQNENSAIYRAINNSL